MFHQPLPPGKATVDVTVYEPSSDPKTVQVGSRLIVFQPSAEMLLVGEEFSIQNQSKPPVAYFKQGGDFEFEVPPNADLGQASSWGPSGMPVTQGTINLGKQRYAIAYAFQPGDNGVRLSYHVPYPGNQTKLQFMSPYATQRVMLVAPPTMQISGPGFVPAGSEQGFNLFTRDAVPSGLPFEVTISGTAPPPSAQQSQGGGAGQPGAGATGQDQVNGRDSGPTIQAMPNRLDSLRWILIGGLAMLFAIGVLLVWRKPVPAFADAANGNGVAAGVSGGNGSARNSPRTGRKSAARAERPANGNAAVNTDATREAQPAVASEIDREVEQNLDTLRDKLFRLELRRQAGTITEEEYARERSRTEQVLRELVRG
jgi:hypothetical protein